MDFNFRYRLDDMNGINNKKIKDLEGYYMKLISSLLEVVEFTSNSEVITIDGFKFVNSDEIIKLH